MAERGNILGPLDAEQLQNLGHLRAHADGTMKLHRRRLNRSSDEESGHISLDVTLDSPTSAFLDAFSTIPQRLISKATLEYVGFSADKATAIWNSWSDFGQATDDYGDGEIMSLLDFITGPFDSRGDNGDDGNDEQWRRTMDSFGLSADFQDKVMHPVFRELRLTQSCAYWCKDTIEMRYEALWCIQQSSLDRERLLQADQNHGHNLSGSSQQHQALGPTPFIGPSMGPLANSSGIQQQPGHHHQESAASASASIFDGLGTITDIAASGIEGHILLFKGIDEARADGFLDAQGSIQDMTKTLSSAPSDFGSERYYFTPELKTAQYYAGYAKIRGTDETNVIIICIAIPNQVLQDLTGDALQYLYWPSEEWKEYVRYNRARRNMPFALRRFRRATLLIGSTAKKSNFAWRQLTGPRGVTEDFVLMIDGQPTIQYVFDGSYEGHDFLKENIASRPYVYHFTKGDWNTWLVEYRG